MNNDDDVLNEVISIVRQVAGPTGREITPTVSLLTDIDLDSLRMIELGEALKSRFGVDLFAPPFTLADLRTPETIAAAIGGGAASVPADADEQSFV